MKDFYLLRLWDRYSGLFTKTQREITDLYFNCDLSLSEIAEQMNCSRQSVSDCLTTCRKKLEEFEEKLHLVALTDSIEAFAREHPELNDEIEKILENGK